MSKLPPDLQVNAHAESVAAPSPAISSQIVPQMDPAAQPSSDILAQALLSVLKPEQMQSLLQNLFQPQMGIPPRTTELPNCPEQVATENTDKVDKMIDAEDTTHETHKIPTEDLISPTAPNNPDEEIDDLETLNDVPMGQWDE